VLAAADDGVLQAYRVAMVARVARDPAAGVLLALSAVFMLTGVVLVVLVSRAGWGLLAVGVLNRPGFRAGFLLVAIIGWWAVGVVPRVGQSG